MIGILAGNCPYLTFTNYEDAQQRIYFTFQAMGVSHWYVILHSCYQRITSSCNISAYFAYQSFYFIRSSFKFFRFGRANCQKLGFDALLCASQRRVYDGCMVMVGNSAGICIAILSFGLMLIGYTIEGNMNPEMEAAV